jgi:hypothetical protein
MVSYFSYTLCQVGLLLTSKKVDAPSISEPPQKRNRRTGREIECHEDAGLDDRNVTLDRWLLAKSD